MGKNTKIVSISAIVLLYPILLSTQASAGFYDWMTSREESRDILVQSVEENRASFDDFYRWTKSIVEEPQEEPKIEYDVVRESFRQVTAYNVGDRGQTDSTPCIGAYSKVNLCDEVAKGVRVCAANFVRLGTMLRIVRDDNQSFECIVWDRMHSRFSARVDIAMSLSEKTQAKQFGRRTLKVQILDEKEINKDRSSI